MTKDEAETTHPGPNLRSDGTPECSGCQAPLPYGWTSWNRHIDHLVNGTEYRFGY